MTPLPNAPVQKENNPPLLGSGFSVEEEMLGSLFIEKVRWPDYQAKP
jgi:hypothetical protein